MESGRTAFHQPKAGERDALILDVFPKAATTDLAAMKQAIMDTKIDGVVWSPDMVTEQVRGLEGVVSGASSPTPLLPTRTHATLLPHARNR